MSIFNHRIYDNLRTRVIVLQRGHILLHPPQNLTAGWTLPGGGLEPHESLVECAAREVYEETGIAVAITGVAFLREWVVPKHCQLPDAEGRYGYGLEVYFYGVPDSSEAEPRPEVPDGPCARWTPLERLAQLPLWPRELRPLALALLDGVEPREVPSFIAQLEEPSAQADPTRFA